MFKKNMPDTFLEDVQKYTEIDSRLFDLWNNTTYDIDDNRRNAFSVLRSVVMYSEVVFHIFHAKNQKTLSPNVFNSVFGLPMDAPHSWWDNFFIMTKNSFVANFNFLIENLFKTILSEMDLTRDPPQGYYSVVKKMLKEAEIPNWEEKLKVFHTLAMLRNALHNNGIHAPTHPDNNLVIVDVDGIEFKFEKGEQTSANIVEIAVLINKIIDYLKEIIFSQKVKDIQGPIKQFYVPRF